MVFYTETHFHYEEAVMEFIGYAGLGEHKKIHQEMEQRTKGLALSLDADPVERLRKALFVLREWWIEHIQKSDRMYAPLLLLLKPLTQSS